MNASTAASSLISPLLPTIATCALLLGCSATEWPVAQSQQDLTELATDFAQVSDGSARSPLGSFLLLRRGQEVCAVKFVSFNRKRDETPATAFTSGEETTAASYESIYLSTDTMGLNAALAVRIRATTTNSASIGLGHVIALKLGAKLGVRCGPHTFLAMGVPHVTSAVEFPEGYRTSAEWGMAPTAFEDLSRIDLRHPKLIWYDFKSAGTSKRRDLRIPRTSLPY